MKDNKILATILLTASTLAFTACGNTATTASAAGTTENNQVMENATTAESETAVKESVTPKTTETEFESEATSGESDKDPNFNGAGHEGTLEQTTQSYITYESIDPVTMYVISNTTGERYSTYHDPNVSEGELVVSGLVDANQELQIDGKATYNGVDYYRLSFQEEMMLNHQIIIPADLVTDKLQEVEVQQPVETEKPVEQQPEVQQQPEQTPPPSSENNTPEWTPDTGVSKEDWDAFFGGGNTTGQREWQPDYGGNVTVGQNENGGFTITDPNDELVDGVLTFN